MRRVLATLLLTAVSVMSVEAQEWLRPLRVPMSNDRPVLVDGFFATEEWEDALRVPGSDPCEIYLKRYGGNVFVGVKCPDLELPTLDLCLNPVGEGVYQLHVSGHLADRVVDRPGGVESPWKTHLSLDWTANKVRWDTGIRDSLAAIGVYGQEMLRQSVLPFDGFEVRIREGQFNSPQWYLRFQIAPFTGDDALFIFPPNRGPRGAATDWLLLSLFDLTPDDTRSLGRDLTPPQLFPEKTFSPSQHSSQQTP